MAGRYLSERMRKFLREVGSIVLGVLIALAIGEVAVAVRHRIDAGRALNAVRLDMIDNASAFDLRPLVDVCARRRLATVSRELERARLTGRLADIGEIGRTGTRSFRTGNWESAVGSGNTLYMDENAIAELTDYHLLISDYVTLQDEAAIAWTRLSVLSHAPGRIDDNTLSASRQTLAELQYRSDRTTRLAATLLDIHRKKLGYPVIYSTFNLLPYSREIGTRNIRAQALCRPLQIDGRNAEPGEGRS